MQTPATQQDDAALQESSPDSPLYELLPPGSLADFVEEDRPFSVTKQEDGEIVKRVLAALLHYPPTPGARPAPTTVICVDPGKFSNKVGGIQQRRLVEREGVEYEEEVEPRFVHVTEPVALKLAERATFSEGPSAQTWRLLSTSSHAASGGDGEHAKSFSFDEPYLIGEEATRGTESDAVPVYDDFHLRWRLALYKAVWYASIAKAALAIGLRPTLKYIDEAGEGSDHPEQREVKGEEVEAHRIVLCVCLPDKELYDERGTVTLHPETRAALEEAKGLFLIEWTDAKGRAWLLKLDVVKIDLVAQTMGAWLALFSDIEGNPVAITRQDDQGKPFPVEGNVIIDEWGGGDRQRGRFQLEGRRPRMYAEKLEEGTHLVAESLRRMVYAQYKVRPTLAQAQLALATGQLDLGGDPIDITPLLEQLRKTRFEKLLTSALVTDEVRLRFWIHVGGGVRFLHQQLAEFILANGVKPSRFLLVCGKVSTLMPLIGGWAWAYLRLLDDLRKLRQQEVAQEHLREDLKRRLNLALSHIPYTNAGWGRVESSLKALLTRMEEVPSWAGHLEDLQSIDREFQELLPVQPWLLNGQR
jgi:hypothetical protein